MSARSPALLLFASLSHAVACSSSGGLPAGCDYVWTGTEMPTSYLYSHMGNYQFSVQATDVGKTGGFAFAAHKAGFTEPVNLATLPYAGEVDASVRSEGKIYYSTEGTVSFSDAVQYLLRFLMT